MQNNTKKDLQRLNQSGSWVSKINKASYMVCQKYEMMNDLFFVMNHYKFCITNNMYINYGGLEKISFEEKDLIIANWDSIGIVDDES